MKKIIPLLTIILISFLISCKKNATSKSTKEESPAYDYSSDLQSALDISFATYAISDIDMICSFMAEDKIPFIFYSPAPGTTTLTFIRDISSKSLIMSYNKTSCSDHYLRDGSLFFGYGADPLKNPAAIPGADHCRDFGFSGWLMFSGFTVDNWKLDLFDASLPAHIVNTLIYANYDPAVVKLTWEISGKFKFTHRTELNRDMVWEGKIVKTLTNTNDTNVFKSDKSSGINWPLAKVAYTGTVTGKVLGDKAFTYSISSGNPVTRDFTCAYVPPGSNGVTQYHPFISGVATATIANYHPRTINYGPSNTCDNSGTISFSSETHTVTFD